MSFTLSYREHLFNKKWREKREHIMKRDGSKCRHCGATSNLTVHHTQYHVTEDGQKLLPWMYEDKFLITLCEKCHMEGHRKYKVPIVKVKLPGKSVFD